MLHKIVFIVTFVGLLSLSVSAQTTSFTYQGKLIDSGTAATGTYDFEFTLYDADTGGTATGTLLRPNVTVTGGVFTVNLDFGDVYPRFRFLEIKVKLSAGSTITTLSPRQPITSAPTAVRSLAATTADNALLFRGEPPSSFVYEGDSRLTNDRNPLPNSANYIRNGTATQASSDFNISGNGTVGGTLNGNIFNSDSQYNILGNRVLANPGNLNLFVGTGTGPLNTGMRNTFAGANAGGSSTEGNRNSFFGRGAGFNNRPGNDNSFFGDAAGVANRAGSRNSFFGQQAGQNTTSDDVDDFNVGSDNTFLGFRAGNNNVAGSKNTLIGADAEVGATNLTEATAIGANARVEQSSSIVLGTTDTRVGIGTSAPSSRLHIIGTGLLSDNALQVDGGGNAFGTPVTVMRVALGGSDPGTVASFGGHGDFRVDGPGVSGGRFYITEDGRVGINLNFGQSPDKLGVNGNISFIAASGGGSQLCQNAQNQISLCGSSSVRFKSNINPLNSGMSLIRRLRPVLFNWKSDNKPDLGLIAEEVAAVDPQLALYNKKGEVEGVKYDRVGVVLVNAVKEQQAELDEKTRQIAELTKSVAELKAIVCAQNSTASVCQPE